MKTLDIPVDAFSDGQVGSKKWLVKELSVACKHIGRTDNHTVWVLGGWVGILPFMMLTVYDITGEIGIQQIRSFDIDESVVEKADRINNVYEIDEWRFKAFPADANNVFDNSDSKWGPLPSIVINTSTEHFSSDKWFCDIPDGTIFVTQSTDMELDDHTNRVNSISEMDCRFPSRQCVYLGKRNFKYPKWEFNRFMKIGVK